MALIRGSITLTALLIVLVGQSATSHAWEIAPAPDAAAAAALPGRSFGACDFLPWYGTVRYFNSCNGWDIVHHWDDGERLGVNMTADNPSGTRLVPCNTWTFVDTAAPSGYGLTGTISLYRGDLETGAAVETQPFLATATGWHSTSWDMSAGHFSHDFAIEIRFGAGAEFNNPTGIRSENFSSCGQCEPAASDGHSYLASPDAPWNKLQSGNCDIEWYIDTDWMAVEAVSVTDHTSGHTTWGRIKALYQ